MNKIVDKYIKFLVHCSYRTGFYLRWMTLQFFFIIPSVLIIIIHSISNIILSQSLFDNNLSFFFYLSMIIINFNSIYILIVAKNRSKYLSEHLDFIIKQDKVVCGWKDENLELNKVYDVLIPDAQLWYGHSGGRVLKDTDFVLSNFNTNIFKLISLKESRKLKLKKIS